MGKRTEENKEAVWRDSLQGAAESSSTSTARGFHGNGKKQGEGEGGRRLITGEEEVLVWLGADRQVHRQTGR